MDFSRLIKDIGNVSFTIQDVRRGAVEKDPKGTKRMRNKVDKRG
jgi:hypothetical protein